MYLLSKARFLLAKQNKPFLSIVNYLMKEPGLSKMLNTTISGLEESIPQMISFVESPIDQQPWERAANAHFVSPAETEVDLLTLVRDVLGHASIPGIFGRAFMDNNPWILQDVSEMDKGMMWLLTGLPAWTPWPSLVKAHIARRRVKDAVEAFHKALDANAEGGEVAAEWGDMDDVCEFIMKRHELFRSMDLLLGKPLFSSSILIY